MFKVCCQIGWSGLHYPHGKAYHSHSYGDYDNLNDALDRFIAIIANRMTPLKNEIVDYYINCMAPRGVYPIVSHTYSYEECVKLIVQRQKTRRLIAELCVLKGLPAGDPCWIAQKISVTSGN